MCDSEHQVFALDRPFAICVTDQHFVSNMSGNSHNCIPVARLENGSLDDLADLAFELLEHHKPPPGSIIMLCSGSHLAEVGVTAYCSDWVNLVHRIGNKWREVTVCPLPPLFQGSMELGLVRELTQLATWLKKVYDTSPAGLHDLWATVVSGLDKSCLESGEVIGEVISTRVPLPRDLRSAKLAPVLFTYNSAGPVSIVFLNRKVITELVTVLICTIRRDFGFFNDPEVILARDSVQDINESSFSGTLVVIGGSNMRSLLPYLSSSGLRPIDLTCPGFIPSPDALVALKEKIDTLTVPKNSVAVLDLAGNITHRYKQFDGMGCLPVKIGTGYHLPGEVCLIENRALANVVSSYQGILDSLKCVKIIVPPLPRYIGKSCCSDPAHCVGFSNDNVCKGLIEGLQKIRKEIKTQVCKSRKDTWVLDSMGGLVGTLPLPGAHGLNGAELLPKIKAVLGTDGVHLNDTGKENLCNSICCCVKGILTGTIGNLDSASVSVSGHRGPERRYHWHGFNSTCGSKMSSRSLSWRQDHQHRGGPHMSRGGVKRPHPYRRN
jgi:hypothetical protein